MSEENANVPAEGGGEQPQTAGGVVSGSEQAAEPTFADGQFKSVADLEKAYTELRKRFSAGEHKAEPKAEAPAPAPQSDAPPISEKDLADLQNYRVEQRRQAINESLGLDYDTDQWRAVADFVNANRTPEQIQAIETAIEAGLYGVVREVVDEFNKTKASEGVEMPTGTTPKSGQLGGATGFQSKDEALQWFRQNRSLNSPAKAREWNERLAATHASIREQLNPTTGVGPKR